MRVQLYIVQKISIWQTFKKIHELHACKIFLCSAATIFERHNNIQIKSDYIYIHSVLS